MRIVGEFIEYPEFWAPKIDRETAETPNSIDLRDMPLETIIEFHGQHPVSQYIAQLTDGTRLQGVAILPESQTGKYMKIWLNRDANCAVGPLDGLAWPFDSAEERYLMALGKSYVIPYFTYWDGESGRRELKLSFTETRFEQYRRIFVQKPTS